MGLTLGAVWIGFALVRGDLAGDFRSFYASGVAWLQGLPLYPGDPARPNLNSPTATVLLFATFARLPIAIAARLWVALGCLSVVASFRVIRRSLGASLQDTISAAALLLAGFAAFSIWVEGQILWFLSYPLTCAWAAYRDGRCGRAGMWMAPVIATKPMFALAACALGVRTMLAAGLSCAVVTVAIAMWTGLQAWRDWIATGREAAFLAWPTNGSLWGLLARAHGAGLRTLFPMRAFGPWAVIGASLCAAIVGSLWFARRADADRRWLAAHVASILISPIGWVFYGVMLVGPLMALWPESRRVRVGVWCATVPVTFLYPWGRAPVWWFALGGSLACWGLLVCLSECVRMPRECVDPKSAESRPR